MNEFLGMLPTLDRVGAVSTVLVMAFLVITDKLVWHKRLQEQRERADRWEKAAWDAITIGAAAGVKAAEVTATVVSALPDPALIKQEE